MRCHLRFDAIVFAVITLPHDAAIADAAISIRAMMPCRCCCLIYYFSLPLHFSPLRFFHFRRFSFRFRFVFIYAIFDYYISLLPRAFIDAIIDYAFSYFRWLPFSRRCHFRR